MRLPHLFLIMLLIVNLSVDGYIYKAVSKRFQNSKRLRNLILWSCIALTILWGVIFCWPNRGGSDQELDTLMWMLFGYFSIYVPKYIFTIFDLAASIPLLWHKRRSKPLTMIGFILALIAFATIWWGAMINRTNTQVSHEDIYIPDLPEQFEDYRIAQFSDFHLGTYGRDTSFVAKVVAEINALSPDLIVFTGDLVSRKTSELLPFVEVLSRLHAPDGVFSVLGNHDYGDYYNWKTENQWRENIVRLIDLQKEMGWHMLNNSYATITRDSAEINLIGVENVGDPPFRTYGSLSEAYPNVGDSTIKILLSHNPAHWMNDIADHSDVNIALTLAGHTHAMQMSMFGISPARMRYKAWGGLYHDKNFAHQLYVNIGVGTVGIPLRIGATPELTVLTLKRGNPAIASEKSSPIGL